MKPWLRDGTTGFFREDGTRQCTGSMMGRRDILPDSPATPIKLHMERLRFSDGCYDKGGAYWGCPENLYCAYAAGVQIFVRADARTEAKTKVRESIPGARFYN